MGAVDAGARRPWAWTRRSKQQPGYRNIDIARGAQDRYIVRFARSLARFPGTVWLRYAHEMNGYWYPWSPTRRRTDGRGNGSCGCSAWPARATCASCGP